MPIINELVKMNFETPKNAAVNVAKIVKQFTDAIIERKDYITYNIDNEISLYLVIAQKYNYDIFAGVLVRDKQWQRFEREIVALEKKVLQEKQFDWQVELNGGLQRLRKEMEE